MWRPLRKNAQTKGEGPEASLRPGPHLSTWTEELKTPIAKGPKGFQIWLSLSIIDQTPLTPEYPVSFSPTCRESLFPPGPPPHKKVTGHHRLLKELSRLKNAVPSTYFMMRNVLSGGN